MEEPAPAHMHRGILALTGVVLALVLAFIWLRVTMPSAGARLDIAGDQRMIRQGGWIIQPWNDSSGALHSGDIVVAVNGRSVDAITKGLISPRAWQSLGRAGQDVTYRVIRQDRPIDVTVPLQSNSLLHVLGRQWNALFSVTFFLLVGLFVYSRRPATPAAQALVLAALGAFANVVYYFGLEVGDLTGGIGFWLSTIGQMGYLLLCVAVLHFWLVFPTPRAIVIRHPWIVPMLYLPAIVMLAAGLPIAWVSTGGSPEWLDRSGLIGGIPALGYVATALVAAIFAWRSARDPISRRQIRWVTFAILLSIAGLAVWYLLPRSISHGPALDWAPSPLLAVPIPLAIAVAILRYHLFDIDLVLSRTLIWGTLTAFVIGVYVLVVGLLGALVSADGHFALSLVATGLVALLFQPLRERVQRIVNHFIYGDRDDPYAVVSRLGQRLEATLAPEAVLPAIAETVAQALKLPYVAIALRQNEGLTVAAAYGTPGRDSQSLPLVYQSEPVGELTLAPRAPGAPFNSADQRLLEDLARQVGIAAHAVRLTDDLQRSRQRIVTAREEERRRLRRDLHDGLGPSLASIMLKIEAARNLLPRDPASVDTLLAELKAQTQTAIGDIRRAVYDLRPPALDELGLIPALYAHATRVGGDGLRIVIDAPATLSSLPAAVEVAAFRIALEALTNTVRHAHAHTCTIRLSLTDALLVEVIDDGIGIPPNTSAGVGLTSMRERAEELGGSLSIEPNPAPARGTRILARLPFSHEAEG